MVYWLDIVFVLRFDELLSVYKGMKSEDFLKDANEKKTEILKIQKVSFF